MSQEAGVSAREKLAAVQTRVNDKEVLNVPGNIFALSELVESLSHEHHHRRPIAFVGAGASAELYPLWQQLLAELGKSAFDQGLINEEVRTLWIELGQEDPPGVAKSIQDLIGDAEFNRLFYSTFHRKAGDNGKYFTKAHCEIIQTDYKAFVTTNYDPGLLEARIRLRTDCNPTGFCTRLNRDRLTAWLDGSLFDEDGCPVFYAHGIVDESSSWVLNSDQYDEAYSDRLYIRVLEKLWIEERLVCIGFSFKDPWIKMMANRLTRELMQNSARGMRHFAFVGYRFEVEHPNAVNRRYWSESVGARVIYYPVYKTGQSWSDHSALIELLSAIRMVCTCTCAVNAD